MATKTSRPKTKPKPKTAKKLAGKSARKKTAKKPAQKKPVVKKLAQKKPAAKRPAQKKPVVKKAAPKKPAVKKPAAARKPVGKKPAARKKPAVKKLSAKKTAPKKPAVAKKPAGKKVVKKRAVAKPAKARKAPVQKKSVVKAPAKAAAVKPLGKTAVKPVVVEKPMRAAVVSSTLSKTQAVKKPQETKVTTAAKPGQQVADAIKKPKMLQREFMLELAHSIRAAVAPLTRESRGGEVVGTATSGDATFELDRVAEKALLTFLKNARVPVAYYSEDSGYTTFTNAQPQHLLIVDPIDGTRAAKSGFENCVVSIASTRVIERPVMADVDSACVVEILGNRVFYAERGKGVRITQDGHVRRFRPGENPGLEALTWSMTVPGRPADLIFPTAAKLLDLTSLKGGFFACNSTSYSLTRLLTNQLDACVDIANRFYRDIPDLVRDHFINAGRGTVLGIEPYDLAAALLIVQEGGCIVTDAYGKSFDDLLLLDTSTENMRSMIAASNKAVHAKLISFFDLRVRQWEELLRRRAEHAARIAAQKQQAQPQR